jgi:hypothetical protein
MNKETLECNGDCRRAIVPTQVQPVHNAKSDMKFLKSSTNGGFDVLNAVHMGIQHRAEEYHEMRKKLEVKKTFISSCVFTSVL